MPSSLPDILPLEAPEGGGAVLSSVNKRILRGMLGGAGLAFVTATVGIIQIPLVLSYLSKNLAGVWFLFMSIGVYVTFLDLGVSPTISREIGFVLGKGSIGETEKQNTILDLLATSAKIFQIVALFVLAAGVLGGFIFWGRGVSSPDRVSIGIAWGIFVLGASVNVLGASGYSGLYGLGHVGTERVLKSAGLLVGLLLSVGALWGGGGLVGLATAWGIQNALSRLAARFALRHYFSPLKRSAGTARWEIARQIAGPSLKWAAMGLGALLILYTDNPIIASMLGPSHIPPYEAAMKMVSTLMFLSLIVSSSSVPFISRAYVAGDLDGCRTLFSRTIRFGMFGMLFLASFLSQFGHPLVNIWLGPGQFVGYPVLWLLLVILTLECHHVISATAVMATGSIVFLIPALLAGLLKVGISLGLSRTFGLFGVAMGTLVAQVLTNNWFAPFMALKVFRVSFLGYGTEVLLPLTFFGVIITLVNIGLRHFLSGRPFSPLEALGMAFLGSAGVGALLAPWLAANARERQKLVVYFQSAMAGFSRGRLPG